MELVLSQARNPVAVSLLTFPNILQNFDCKFPCHYLVCLKYIFPGESDQRRCWEPQRCRFSMNQFYLSLIADCIPHPGLGGPAYVYNSKTFFFFKQGLRSNSVEERPFMWEKMQGLTSEATLHTVSTGNFPLVKEKKKTRKKVSFLFPVPSFSCLACCKVLSEPWVRK